MKKLLVVEDTQDVREEICDILKMEDYEVLNAENGLEAMKIAKSELPDLIVSDIMMPIVDGYQFFKELKKFPSTENIPIIFLSAKADNEDIRYGMNLGADDYLTKPLSPENLIISVKNKLQKAEKYNEKLEELRKNISNFLPHELKTPLNGILGFSEYLKNSISDISREEMEEIVNYIYDGGIRLQRFVENYAAFADLNVLISDKYAIDKIRKTPFIETNEIIEKEAKKHIKNEYRENDLELNIEDESIRIEEYHLKKIINELLDNAIKFSIPGNKIKISAITKKNKYIFKVYNKGRGITEEQIANIGGFMQFDRKEYEQQGLGLGLAIVQLIAKVYDAKMEVKSEPNDFFSISITFNLK